MLDEHRNFDICKFFVNFLICKIKKDERKKRRKGFWLVDFFFFPLFLFFVFLGFLSEVFVQIWSYSVSITLGIFLVSLVLVIFYEFDVGR